MEDKTHLPSVSIGENIMVGLVVVFSEFLEDFRFFKKNGGVLLGFLEN